MVSSHTNNQIHLWCPSKTPWWPPASSLLIELLDTLFTECHSNSDMAGAPIVNVKVKQSHRVQVPRSRRSNNELDLQVTI
jgi:hypothetical protein